MLTPFVAPPADYYQANCRTVFQFVLDQYAPLLDGASRAQLGSYLHASDDAQRLFARLLTRKGPIYRIDSLSYKEVADLPRALNELEASLLIQINPRLAADNALNILRKSELQNLVPELPAPLRRGRKRDLIDHFCTRFSDVQLCNAVSNAAAYLTMKEPRIWRTALMLFFGRTGQDFSAFVTRDLGMMTYETVEIEAQYGSRSELRYALALSELNRLTRRVSDFDHLQSELPRDLLRALSSLQLDNRWLNNRRQRGLSRLAQHFERQALYDDALCAYAQVQQHPARERQVRILKKMALDDQASNLLQEIRACPWSQAEALFAERFGKRNGGFQPDVQTFDIDRVDAECRIEEQAMGILLQQSNVAWVAYVENSLVRTLTGLFYWPLIFTPIQGAFTNPFQAAPNDLYADDFLQARQHVLEELESRYACDESMYQGMREVAQSKRGIANPLVSWGLLEQLTLDDLLALIPADDIRALAACVIRNLPERRTGLPDLLVAYMDGAYAFVEVKGPNDQLQPGQRIWLQTFQDLHIDAWVMRLRIAT